MSIISKNVGARSIWLVTTSVFLLFGTLGPRIIIGILISVSKLHSLPGCRRCDRCGSHYRSYRKCKYYREDQGSRFYRRSRQPSDPRPAELGVDHGRTHRHSPHLTGLLWEFRYQAHAARLFILGQPLFLINHIRVRYYWSKSKEKGDSSYVALRGFI